MKYLISCLLVMLAAVYGTAQKIDSADVAKLSPGLREEVNNYLAEAKQAKTTGMTLSITGGAIALVGSIIYSAAVLDDIENMFSTTHESNTGAANVGAGLVLVGAGLALGSIPFFVKVHKKRNAARAIVFADKGMSFTPNVLMPGTRSAGIGLVIALGGRR